MLIWVALARRGLHPGGHLFPSRTFVKLDTEGEVWRLADQTSPTTPPHARIEQSGRALGNQGDELEVLVTLAEAYERQHYPIDLPDRSKPSSFGWTGRQDYRA